VKSLDPYRQVVELSADCVLGLDFSGHITSINELGCLLLHAHGPGELVGMPWASLWTTSSRELARDAFERAKAGEAVQFSATAKTIDNAELFWHVTAMAARDEERQVDTIVAICRDRTERFHVQAALEAMNVALNERLGIASRAQLAGLRREAMLRDRLGLAIDAQELAARIANHTQNAEAVAQSVAGIAHDFNNMLQTVIVGLSAVCDEPDSLTAKQQRLLAFSLQGAHSASALVRRLMAFSGKHPFKAEELDLRSVIENIVGLIGHSLGGNMALALELTKECFPVVADRHSVEQALMNLCINARDASGGHGVIIVALVRRSVSEQDITEMKEPGEYVVLSVTDHGTGIDDVTRERMFEPYFTTKGEHAGTGLGLAQVHGFMRQSGGFVDVESELGRGTTMSLWFPQSSSSVGS
jgi:PAS domain S-box-containing protein